MLAPVCVTIPAIALNTNEHPFLHVLSLFVLYFYLIIFFLDLPLSFDDIGSSVCNNSSNLHGIPTCTLSYDISSSFFSIFLFFSRLFYSLVILLFLCFVTSCSLNNVGSSVRNDSSHLHRIPTCTLTTYLFFLPKYYLFSLILSFYLIYLFISLVFVL